MNKYVIALAASVAMVSAAMAAGILEDVPTTITTDRPVSPTDEVVRIMQAGNTEPAVIIYGDGRVKIGEGWANDEAARLFWERVGTNAPCAP